MKKHQLWILILSALLCVSVLFASCTSDTPEDTEGPTDIPTEIPTDPAEEDPTEETYTPLVDEKVDYKALISQWTKYISVTERENYPNGTYDDSRFIASEDANEDIRMSYPLYIRSNDIPDPNDEFNSFKKQSVYNAELNKQLFTFTEHTYELESTTYEVRHTINILDESSIIEVITETVSQSDYWDRETKYSYYNNVGASLVKDIDTKAEQIIGGSGYIIGDKTYHYNYNGEIVFITDKLNSYQIPDDSDVFEYKDNLYSFIIDTIQVINPDYVIVAEYKVPDTLVDYEILDNGNVYMYQEINLGADATRFDFETDGEKYNIIHSVLDITTGKVTEIDASFVIEWMASNSNSKGSGLKISNGEGGGAQYAEIRKFSDGVLSPEIEFVILNDKLDIIATLPKLLKNQTGIIEQNGQILVYAERENSYGGSYYTRYAINIESSTLDRITDYPDNYEEYLDGGYIFNGLVYNDKNEFLLDLNEVDDYEIIEYNLYYHKTVTEKLSEDEKKDGVIYEKDDYDNDLKITEKAYIAYISSDGRLIENEIATINSSTTINAPNTDYPYINFYVVETQDEDMTIFDIRGVHLLNLSNVSYISETSVSNDSVLLTVTLNNGTTEYYIIK